MPSHVIANVSMPPEPVEPIAKQDVGDTQETEKRRFGSVPRLLLGEGMIVQSVPSHFIANVLVPDIYGPSK